MKKPLLTLLIGALLTSAYAANVPEGTALAEKQVLVRNNGTEPQSLDPHKIEGVAESHLTRDLFEGLVIVNQEGELEPRLATKWSHENHRIWRFYLRQDALWSDGSPITAHDFVYSWQRLADPETGSPYESYLQYAHIENIDAIIAGEKGKETLGVSALDDYTLEIRLSESIPYLPQILAHTVMSPVPQKVINKADIKWTSPENFVGNGAYKLQKWVVNERIVLERNKYYWDNDKTVIDEVTFLPIASETAEVNRYRSGELDITANVSVELYPKLKQEIPDEIKTSPYLCTYYYGINNQRKPFTDPRVREALKLGLDQELMVNKIKDQGDTPAYSFTPPFISGVEIIKPKWAALPQKERNEKARVLLEEAGFNSDNPLTITLLYNTSDMHKKLAIAAASIWKKNIGIEVKLENQEWKTYTDTRHQGNYDLVRASWCADYDEPSSFLNMMRSDSSVNTVHYKSAEFDHLLDETVQVENDASRALLYQKAERVLDQDSAIIPLYYYANLRLVKPYVGGYNGKNSLGYLFTKDLYIIQNEAKK